MHIFMNNYTNKKVAAKVFARKNINLKISV
jgi:hypothetical protein